MSALGAKDPTIDTSSHLPTGKWMVYAVRGLADMAISSLKVRAAGMGLAKAMSAVEGSLERGLRLHANVRWAPRAELGITLQDAWKLKLHPAPQIKCPSLDAKLESGNLLEWHGSYHPRP